MIEMSQPPSMTTFLGARQLFLIKIELSEFKSRPFFKYNVIYQMLGQIF